MNFRLLAKALRDLAGALEAPPDRSHRHRAQVLGTDTWRTRVLGCMGTEPVDAGTIADRLSADRRGLAMIRTQLSKLVDYGEVERVGPGMYRMAMDK